MSAEVTVTIDGREIAVPAGTLVIRAAEMLDIYIPRFCDHPALAPHGACRQCMVEVEGQRKPLTACTTPVTQGMAVRTQHTSEMAREAQRGVLEMLLINHPLDCPVCDKGGECPLQDQTLAFGPGASRFAGEKRRYPKPVRISPLILLDRERCVLCARCTRFSSEISGDRFIALFERGALQQVAAYEDEPYESPFSGNIVQICPVGALTAEPFRFRARPFDLTSTPSVCTLCASGCRTIVQTRRGEVARILASEDPEVNEEWICDKGRFSFPRAQRPDRATEPLVRKDGELVAVSWAEAAALVAERVGSARERGAPIGVLSGGRLADEDAYALSRFARGVLGTADVDSRSWTADGEEDAVFASMLGSPGATYSDIEVSPLVLLLGCDPREESPILHLRLRKALNRRGSALFEVGPRATALAREPGARSILCSPGTEAGVLLSVAWLLVNPFGLPVDDATKEGLSSPGRAALRDASGVADEPVLALAEALRAAGGRAVILAGERLSRSPGALAVAWNLACALGARFGHVPRRGGFRGELWAGLHPRLLPGGRRVEDPAARAEVERVWGASLPPVAGRCARAILSEAGSLGALFLVGADPASDFAGFGASAVEAAPFVVAQDLFLTESSRRADVVLPARGPAERAGTSTDWEGRAAEFEAAVAPAGLSLADRDILAMLSGALGEAFPTRTRDLRAEMRVLERSPQAPAAVGAPTPALPEPDGLRPFSLVTYPLLLDAGTMLAGSGALLEIARRACVEMHPGDAAALGVSPGDPVRVASAMGEIVGPARLSAGLARGSVFVPANQEGLRALALVDPFAPVTAVRVERA
ncbi:MAG: NADH-quinone oxidoreductase subunit G [Acidobacteria bacterium]|nr:NADH-quinone oxidoreductase subunit G [Acidobacteriota bacterium]